MYKLVIRPKAEKNFSRLPQRLQQKILNSLKKLKNDPFQKSLDVKKLVGTKKSYRMRVGGLRIIYEMNTDLKEISVTDVDFRRTTSY